METSPESPLTESTNDSTSTLSTDDKGRMGMRREFFKDGRFMERENTEMIIDGDTLSFLLYSIRGKWEIHSDSLMLFANMKDVENPEHAGITVNSETIVSTKIIKRITADSLIIQDAAQEMNGNIIDLIMLREK